MRVNIVPVDKPKFGAPCNGCGYCCAMEICKVGKTAWPDAEAPCPGLQISDDGARTFCALVAIEKHRRLEPLIARTLAIGKGCDSDDAPTQVSERG